MNKMKWIYAALTGLMVSFVSAFPANGQPSDEPQNLEQFSDDDGLTVITSVKLTFDHAKQFAEFEENVVVTDPSMTLTADHMKVWFDEENQLKIIEAKGDVYIEQDDTKAWSGRAEYMVRDGKMVLREKPKMTRGKDLLTGDVITFYRDQNKMIVTPRARLVIFPEKGQSTFSLTGE